MSRRAKPSYFEEVRKGALETWELLERKPELFGAWKQLFRQVQKPRHVISELLQNADDAGATWVKVSLHRGVFRFEHNGHDFTRDEFTSLCRFGFSNKRSLFSIGFRGIGFKSVFSLSDTVTVLSPTLAVRFSKDRFTLPEWIEDAEPFAYTAIVATAKDDFVLDALHKSISAWEESPVSLLFFKNIATMHLNGRPIRKKQLGPGPVPNSHRFRLLHGNKADDLVLIESRAEALPSECLAELEEERNLEDLNLPPIAVQLVLGVRDLQRVYVVLPTDLDVKFRFSCNAPFLQDPARDGIKEPAASPTNRWLLQRIGRLAGETMLQWLGNGSLSLQERAQAYRLLVVPEQASSSVASSVAEIVADAFLENIKDRPVLLTASGDLAGKKECLAPPLEAYKLWSPNELCGIFRQPNRSVLSEHIPAKARDDLQKLGLVDLCNFEDLLVFLEDRHDVPRPPDHGLLVLWHLVEEKMRGDYGGMRRQRLALVPVAGSKTLLPATRVVRLPQRKSSITPEAWAFLGQLLDMVDPSWTEFIEASGKPPSEAHAAALELLKKLDLDRPSRPDTIAEMACNRLFSRANVSLEEHVWMAHLLAALDAKTPNSFRCITEDGQQRSLSEGILGKAGGELLELLPEDWRRSHVLHDAYWAGFTACSRDEWHKWLEKEKSGFFPFVPFEIKIYRFFSFVEFDEFNERRGEHVSWSALPYVNQKFVVPDWIFPEEVVKWWEKRAERDSTIWARVGEAVLRAPSWWWESKREAIPEQISQQGNAKPLGVSVPAGWVVLLRGVPCLWDTWGKPRIPCELYLRNERTEPLVNVEPFVRKDLDTGETKKLLILLGVRDRPEGVESLLNRLRGLRGAPDPESLVPEIKKWYTALGNVLRHAASEVREETQKVFASEPLVLTAEKRWRKKGEVFLEPGANPVPGLDFVHPAMRDCQLWEILKVARQPGKEELLAWVGRLSPGEALDEHACRGLREILRLYGAEVWSSVGCWLSLNRRWLRVKEFRYCLSEVSASGWDALHEAIKEETADFSMLPLAVWSQAPFTQLPDLGSLLSYRLCDGLTPAGQEEEMPWMAALGEALLRVRDDDPEAGKRLQEAAFRLSKTRWVTVNGPFRVTPYLDDRPAGQPLERAVLWSGKRLYVAGSLIDHYEAIVAELAKEFRRERITEAIRACLDRAPAFVWSYMKKHFALRQDGPVLPPESLEKAASTSTVERLLPIPVEPATARHRDASRERRTKPKDEHPAHGAGPSPLDVWAQRQGFRWDDQRSYYVNPRGETLRQLTREDIFDWEWRDARGELIRQIWVSSQKLNERGVEVPFEVIEKLKNAPERRSLLVFQDSEQVVEITGVKYKDLIREGGLHLYPSTYRLKIDPRILSGHGSPREADEEAH